MQLILQVQLSPKGAQLIGKEWAQNEHHVGLATPQGFNSLRFIDTLILLPTCYVLSIIRAWVMYKGMTRDF